VQLDEKFEKLIKGIVAQEKKISEAAQKQATPLPWSNFAGEDIPAEQRPESKKETELKDKTFNRDKPNEEYTQKRADKDAKAKDIAVPKITGDFLASYERDKRLQWRSPIRVLAHAFARRAGNGQDNGPFMKNTVDYLTRVYMKSTERQTQES
jgi:hypothetical protein